MPSVEELYEASLPILESKIEDEDKTDKLEELIKARTSLTGKPLETTVLDILWRYRNATASSAGLPTATSPSVRHTVVRRNSPAPWQATSRSSTPLAGSPRSSAASPAPPPGLSRPALFRMRSSQQSPFTSPRASPRTAFANLANGPYSPGIAGRDLHAAGSDVFGDYMSDNAEWLAGDDTASNASSGYVSDWLQAGEYAQAPMIDMSPYDILRSVLRDQKTDEEIEAVLEANGYDLSAAIMSLMEQHEGAVPTGIVEPEKTFLVGKSMASAARSSSPTPQGRSNIVCKYWLSTGQCLRADCRFSHDLSNHLCKYWLQGSCLAGDSCIFSHDPAALMESLSVNDPAAIGSDSLNQSVAIQANDYSSFPMLQTTQSAEIESSAQGSAAPTPSLSTRSMALAPEFFPSRQHSRPSSSYDSHSRKSFDSGFAADEQEAFPALGAAIVKPSKKHHGKRGHGHNNRDKAKNQDRDQQTLANIVRRAPSPKLSAGVIGNTRRTNEQSRATQPEERKNSTTSRTIPAPQHIPWLETGEKANKDYLKARHEAIKHGGARNKFLQSAAQAWNRNDVRAAKALSLRGQSENDLMREAHREAARALYESRNRNASESEEIYVDLHGLHPAESIAYLESAIKNQKSRSAISRDEGANFLYAIVGTGHHSKGGRDKVGKAIRSYLNDSRYTFKEFSVPGDRGGSGGILGIDCTSGTSSADEGNDAIKAN